MSTYKVVEKASGITEEIEAVSSNQALFKAALSKVPESDSKAKKKAAGRLYAAMLKSHEAIRVNNPNQMELFS